MKKFEMVKQKKRTRITQIREKLRHNCATQGARSFVVVFILKKK